MSNFQKKIKKIISKNEIKKVNNNKFNEELKENIVNKLLKFINDPNVLRTLKTMSKVHQKYMSGQIMKFVVGKNKDYFIVFKIKPIDNSEKYFEINKIVMSVFYYQSGITTQSLNQFLQGKNAMQGDISILTIYRNVQWNPSISFLTAVNKMTNIQLTKLNEYIDTIDMNVAKESFLYQIKHYLTS